MDSARLKRKQRKDAPQVDNPQKGRGRVPAVSRSPLKLKDGRPPSLRLGDAFEPRAGESALDSGPDSQVAEQGGAPLPTEIRSDFEARFGQDFSQVRVHTDSMAATSAASIGARAYTHGQHVVFAQGRFDPVSETGRALLAHELAHTIQQRASGNEPSGNAPAREREADRAASKVTAGSAPPTITPLGRALACQSDDTSSSIAKIDAEISAIRRQLLLSPGPRLPLLVARLYALELQRSQLQGSGSTATSDAELERTINDHPAWAFNGGKGSPEGYREIEANTSGDEFARTELFQEWYLKGWAAIRKRPNPGQDLKTLALHLISDPTQRNQFLATVGLEEIKPPQAARPPRALQGPLDLATMDKAAKQAEIDAIRVWQMRGNIDAKVHTRLTETLVLLLADLEKTRDLEEASARTSPPVTTETKNQGVGVKPGSQDVPFGQYANIDIAWMTRGRKVDNPGSETAYFRRYLHQGTEITVAQAQALLKERKPDDEIVEAVLEPSVGSSDSFVVWPVMWQFSSGEELVIEHWWVIRASPDKAERIRRMMISQHRSRIYGVVSEGDYGMGAYGQIQAGRMGGIGGGGRGGGGLRGAPKGKPPRQAPAPAKPTLTTRAKIRPVNGRVNVGGGLEPGSENATNLNPVKPGSGGPTQGIPNHVRAGFEDIGEVFEPGSATSVISNRLRFQDVNWNKAAQGAAKAMPSGGKLSLNVWTHSAQEARAVADAFRNAGFKNVTVMGSGSATIVSGTR